MTQSTESRSDIPSNALQEFSENCREDGIPVSATHSNGVDVFWDRIKEKLIQSIAMYYQQ